MSATQLLGFRELKSTVIRNYVVYFWQVHWRTLTIFNDKKAPEFYNWRAFCLANYSATGSSATGSIACRAWICA